MDATIVGSVISGVAVVIGSIITAAWGQKTKDDKSPKGWKVVALGFIILVISLATVFVMNQFLIRKIPSMAELEELQTSISSLQETLTQKESEVEKLSGENDELSTTNEELKKENQELNEKLNPDITLLSNVLMKNEQNFELSDSPVKDSLGNSYDARSMLLTARSKDNFGKADFYLKGSYSKLHNVTVAISEQTGSSDHEGYEGWFSIYAIVDGKEVVLATSPSLNSMSEKYVFDDINVAGVDWLEVRFSTAENYWNSFTGIVANAELS